MWISLQPVPWGCGGLWERVENGAGGRESAGRLALRVVGWSEAGDRRAQLRTSSQGLAALFSLVGGHGPCGGVGKGWGSLCGIPEVFHEFSHNCSRLVHPHCQPLSAGGIFTLSLRVKGRTREAHRRGWDVWALRCCLGCPPSPLPWHPEGHCSAALSPWVPAASEGPATPGRCPSPQSRQPMGTIGGQVPGLAALHTGRSFAFPSSDPSRMTQDGLLHPELAFG